MMLRLHAVKGNLANLKESIARAGPNAVNSKGLQGETLLHNAAASGHLDVCKYLVLECNADVNAMDEESHSPIQLASHEGYTELR